MKRRSRLAITVVALAMHVLAPFAAYASLQPSPGFGDMCSVVAKATGNASSGAPLPQPGHHAPSHCALCPGGSAFAALPASAAAPAFALTPGASIVPQRYCAAIAAAPTLYPPPRGPPRTFASS